MLQPTIIVQGYASAEGAAKDLAPFPVGAKVLAFVNPQHPDKAYLKQEEFAGPLVFKILVMILPPLAWIDCQAAGRARRRGAGGRWAVATPTRRLLVREELTLNII
jgi:hypothetical protein